MLSYYVDLALRSLRRNVILTSLMVAAVGVGIGTSMTLLTTLIAMSSDPIPDKSSQLFRPQFDWDGYATRHGANQRLPYSLPYRDAEALLQARLGTRQVASYALALNVLPGAGDPFPALGRATSSDFFAMFEAPIRTGAAWGRKEDTGRDNVVVLSDKLAARVFPGGTAVGRTINLGKKDYRVVAVLQPWILTPRFYDIGSGGYADTEDFYLPLSVAIDRQLETSEYGCDPTSLPNDWTQRLNAECGWLEFWVELPTSAQVHDFRRFLDGYAAQQRQLGRFAWTPLTALYDVTDWMAHERVVPNEVRVNSLVAVGFLIVCLINAVGLMLAKFSGRAGELSIRRALGASRRDLFLQCVTEASIIGLMGAFLGLGLTDLGLAALRNLRGVTSQDSVATHLVSLNAQMVSITVGVAVLATVCSGLYPAFRASRIQPAWQLKAQ